MELAELVSRIAEALKCIDSSKVPHKTFQPGVGPYGEPQLVRKLIEHLRQSAPAEFGATVSKREPDVLIPGKWALEFKIVRPFGDNGRLAEHWSENLLHPYEGNVSALGDCLKLKHSSLTERKAVISIAYEHTEPKFNLGVLIRSFELIARSELSIELGQRCETLVLDLIHPVHQRAIVYGWEVK